MRQRSAWIADMPVVSTIAIAALHGSTLASCAPTAAVSTPRKANAISATEISALIRDLTIMRKWLGLI